MLHLGPLKAGWFLIYVAFIRYGLLAGNKLPRKSLATTAHRAIGGSCGYLCQQLDLRPTQSAVSRELRIFMVFLCVVFIYPEIS
jgi:hypothetical protein